MSTDDAAARADVIDRWTSPAGAGLLIRPLRADEAARELRFIASLSPQSRYERVFSHRGLLPGELNQLMKFDVRREIALLVARADDDEIVAVARLRKADTAATSDDCEFAIVVGDAWHRQGVGRRLLQQLVDVARAAGLRELVGYTLASNASMQALARRIGFRVESDPDDRTMMRLSLAL